MRYLSLLFCLACMQAVEEHGGLSPVPSKVTDAEFAAIGATWDIALGAAHVPAIPRLAADGLMAVCIRNCSFFGRSVDSGFMFVIGVYPPNFARVVIHGLKHPSHRCQYAGADGRTHEGWCRDDS